MTGFGLIGAGAAPTSCAAAVLAAGARICAVCDMTSDWAASVADLYNVGKVYSDYRMLLQDPEVEAVCICGCDRETAGEAARAGKHILWQMPCGIPEEEQRQLQQLAIRSGAKLQCLLPPDAEAGKPTCCSEAMRLAQATAEFLKMIR